FDARCAKGTLAVMLSYKAFCGLGREEIKKGITLRNWCVRAGAFAASYDRLRTKDQKFLSQHAKDSYALVRGLASVRDFSKSCGESGGLQSMLSKNGIKINDETEQYLEYHVRQIVYSEYKENDGLATNVSYPEQKDDDYFEATSQERTSKSAVLTGYVWRVL